jgi:membrane protein DedA with SNARE-associated domain
VITHVLSWCGQQHVGAVALFVFGSAAVEHVFPPYPGDLAVALGAAIGVARGWWVVPLLFLAAIAGSMLGATVAFYAGRWLLARRATHRDGPRVARLRAAVEPAVEMVRRQGFTAVALSRFVPVGRAVVIVAAGYGGVSPARALAGALAVAGMLEG